METKTTFVPSHSTVDVRFVRGLDRYSTFPKFVQQAGLNERFAVVQDTYVADCVDMYFDEPLWRALVDFVRAHVPRGEFSVLPHRPERSPLPLDAFLEEWDLTARDDQYPPHQLSATSGGRLVLCMVTDYWTLIGGPTLYHDSYAYSLYSKCDIGLDVMSALANAAGRERWNLALEPVTAPSGFLSGLTRHLKVRFRGR